MSWTYAGDPAASTLAAVRFLIQDTDTTDQLLNDAEINYLLGIYTTAAITAPRAALIVARKFARLATMTRIGDTQVDYAGRADSYFSLAQQLFVDARPSTGVIFIGGLSRERNDDYLDDSDLIGPDLMPHSDGWPEDG